MPSSLPRVGAQSFEKGLGINRFHCSFNFRVWRGKGSSDTVMGLKPRMFP
jgi:hypothetical protein